MRTVRMVCPMLAAVALVLPPGAVAQSFDQTAPVAPSSVPRTPAQRAQDAASFDGSDPKAPLPPLPPDPPPPRFEDHTPTPR